jgi:hypothetical protein
VVARVIGKNELTGGHVYSLTYPRQSTVKGVKLKGVIHVVERRVVGFAKVSQSRIVGR